MIVRAFALLALVTLTPAARAEEGRVVAQLVGGVGTVHPDMPYPGGAVAISLDYGLGRPVSIIFGSSLLVQRTFYTLGIGGGLKLIPLQGAWARLYLLVEPQLLLSWKHSTGDATVADFAVYGGLGFEYLITWGLGVAVELTGTLPAGLGKNPFPETASANLLAGLFMEF